MASKTTQTWTTEPDGEYISKVNVELHIVVIYLPLSFPHRFPLLVQERYLLLLSLMLSKKLSQSLEINQLLESNVMGHGLLGVMISTTMM